MLKPLAPSRRQFVAGALSAAAALPVSALPASSLLEAQHALIEADGGTGHNPTADALLKFAEDGTVRPFAGNTVICHVPCQSRFRDEAARLHDALLAAPFAKKLAILPVESYHMTVFSGANDTGRKRSSWPGGVPEDVSIEECNRVLVQRMRAVRLPGPFPIRVAIDRDATLNYGRACTLRMRGADEAAEKVLRTTRDRLAEAYRYRSPEHDRYGFHITFAYTMHDFTAAEMAEYRAVLARSADRMIAATPVLELGLPEFCTFPDMTRFTTEVILGTA